MLKQKDEVNLLHDYIVHADAQFQHLMFEFQDNSCELPPEAGQHILDLYQRLFDSLVYQPQGSGTRL